MLPALPPILSLQACSGDRKSTRLNSSHTVISYAVFCLKKKSVNDGDWDTLSDAHAQTVGQHARDHRATHSRQASQFSADSHEIGPPNSGASHGPAGHGF